MSDKKMHEHEFISDESLVRQMLCAQFPQWASLPLRRVESHGTDNAIYQLGADMCVRIPRIHWAAHDIEKEQRWLLQFAPHVPLAIPAPLAQGVPQGSCPWPWSVYSWLPGENASVAHNLDLNQAAADLAKFLIALKHIDPAGGPPSRRGMALAIKDSETRQAIDSLHGMIDKDKATKAWEESLQAQAYDEQAVWLHGDLLPGNLLVLDNKLSAVIDWGLLGIGDPACDLIPAWSIFSGNARDIFRLTLAVDDATWLRGRGWALSIALIILPYYLHTNPGLVAVAKKMLSEILGPHAE